VILLIDNYDSFTYNLYQQAGAINPEIKVVKNDQITLSETRALNPSHIIISPGPGRPAFSGICEDVILTFGDRVPILGVCLGHQAICEVYGAFITYANRLMHAKTSLIDIDTASPIFKGLGNKLKVGRYHSLVCDPKSVPSTVKVTATDEEGAVMAVEVIGRPTYGVQFHPESILTENGEVIMRNFLSIH
jgi:anthranilate synthase component 2